MSTFGHPSFDNPPFAPPADIVLDLPAPISVNRSRKIDWANYPKVKAWIRNADAHFLLQKRKLSPAISGRYEIILTLREGSLIDVDNTPKQVIDFVRKRGLVTDDDPAHMRKLTIRFGDVEGCRVTVRPMA